MTEETERRQRPRCSIEHSVFMAMGVCPPVKCTMFDVSELGARIRVGNPRLTPQQFLILLGVVMIASLWLGFV